jgi:hypothetical protein
VIANHTISASFSANTYTVTASAGSGGSITPVGTATVNSGTSQTYTITPAAGYAIADVKIDNVSVGAVPSYTFSNVSASHTISASFAIKSYTVTASSGTGGSISPVGTATVSSGASQTYTITPAAGYAIADVKVDNVSVGAVSSYTFSTISASHTISATFSASTTVTNLLTNSGFESGNLTGWVYSGSVSANNQSKASGNYGAKMSGGWLFYQNFNTTVGKTYYVTAKIRVDRQVVAPSGAGIQILNSAYQKIASSYNLSAANFPLGSWSKVSFSFVATTTQTCIAFQHYSDGLEISADDFVVSPSPIP